MYKALVQTLVLTVLLSMSGVHVVKAAAVTNMYDDISDHQISATGVTHGLSFDIPAASNGETITVTFPAGFTVTAAPTGGTCTGGTVGTFAYTASTMTAVTSSCTTGTVTLTGGAATNPSSAGSYQLSIDVNSGAHSGIFAIPVADSGTVTVTAEVPSTFTFDIDVEETTTYGTNSSSAPYSLPLGVLSVSDHQISGDACVENGSSTACGSYTNIPHVTFSMTSNAVGAGNVYVRSENTNSGAGLYSATADYEISSTTGDLSASTGTEGFGVVGLNLAAANRTTETYVAPYATGGTTVGTLQTTDQQIVSVPVDGTNPLLTVTGAFAFGANIASDTPAASDYTTDVIFTATATY